MPPPSPEQLADRMAVSDVVIAYARALDQRDWTLLRSLLTDPVTIDYSSWDGSPPSARPAQAWVDAVKALAGFDVTQHISANHHVTLDGDRARCVSSMQASHFLQRQGQAYDATLFGCYTSDLVRTGDGWKLAAVKLDVTARQGDQRVFGWAFGGGAEPAPAFVIYGGAISPFVQRVLMQLRAKGLPAEVEPPPGGLHSDAFRSLSPIDKIPVLATAGRHIPESAVIADWIEDAHPDVPLRPADPLARADAALVGRIAELYVMNRMLPLFPNLDPKVRDQPAVDRMLREVLQGLDWLEHYVGREGFASGASLTLADCVCVPILWFVRTFLPAFGVAEPLAGRPGLAAYWGRIETHPAAAATTEDLGRALAAMRAGT